MIVAAIPLNIATADKEANIAAAVAAIRALPGGTDVAVLPELFSTAFIPDRDASAALAETSDGFTITTLRSLADERNIAIAGSYLAKDSSGHLFNRAFFVAPEAAPVFYDKRHVFAIGREAEVITAGTSPIPVAEFRGWKFALCVCYDLRFPCWLRNRDLRYDVLLVPANWPVSRQYAWEHLLIARAIENQAYVVGANRSGIDAFGTYDDNTFIFDYLGKPLPSLPSPGPSLLAEISKPALDKHRTAFPVWKDAD